jgi:glycosyltransferase involved in cell wall biosynthesis
MAHLAPRSLDILVVNWQDRENPHAGGAEIHLHELFGRLAARGHRVRLVCSGWPAAHGRPAGAARTRVDGLDVTRVGGRHSFALLGRGAVRRAIAERRPDVLVEDVNKLPLFLAGITDVPMGVIVPHLFGTTAFDEAPWPLAAAVWLAERPLAQAYRRAGFHAISESTRDDLIDRGVPPGRIRVIHPGVDPDHYRPDPAEPRAPEPRFLYIGRLKRYKGVDVAVRALALARVRRPDLRLDVAGVGDYRAELESVVRSLGQGEAVTFHGFVSEAQKLRLLRSAWANVFPSPKEGWGITVMEAAACGTPSIASDSPGLRDSVRDGTTGFLVPHGSAEALAERMLALAADPSLVQRLGTAARAWAERHSWDHAAELTEGHLIDIITGSA